MRRGVALAVACAVAGCAPLPEPEIVEAGPPAPIIEHVTKQEILTPLPLRVRLPRSYGAEYVVALVLTWGSRDWQVVELDRQGQTWRGEVSCREVSTVTGPTRYFFLALDPSGQAVLDSGSPEWPYVATVVGTLPEGAHGLPGDPIPGRCHDVADCPPDFPGCPAYAVHRPRCVDHDGCASGVCEWDGYCRQVEPDEEAFGIWDEDEQLARTLEQVKARYRTARRIAPSAQ
ncbi:MAG: hypothetical protein RIF41_10060 [Polyangiaceae bacterium]